MTDDRRDGRFGAALEAISDGRVGDGLDEYADALEEALDDGIDGREQRTRRTDAIDALDDLVWDGRNETDWQPLVAGIDAAGGKSPHADAVLAAAIARNVVRAEYTPVSWDDVPADALAFLGGIPAPGAGGTTFGWEVSFSYYGWAFDHPSVDPLPHIRERAAGEEPPIWSPSALACAAHVDFEAAVEALGEIAADSDYPASTVSYLVTIREDQFPGEAAIGGWDWTRHYDYRFRWSEPRTRFVATTVEDVVDVDVSDHASIEAVRDAIDEPMRAEEKRQ